jgi:integrase
MQAAVGDGLIAKNPCKSVKAPKCDTPEKRALTKKELADLLDKMDSLPLDGRVMAVYLMCMLGLRRGECLALTWEDVTSGVVSVSKTVVESSGTVGAPKSKAGVRRLPVPSRLRKKLKKWRKTCESEYVCCDTKGGRLHAQNLRRWWMVHGVPGVSLHELRHSNLTMMAGHMGAFDLSKWAGWSSVEPARVYVHDDLDRLTAAAKAVEL